VSLLLSGQTFDLGSRGDAFRLACSEPTDIACGRCRRSTTRRASCKCSSAARQPRQSACRRDQPTGRSARAAVAHGRFEVSELFRFSRDLRPHRLGDRARLHRRRPNSAESSSAGCSLRFAKRPKPSRAELRGVTRLIHARARLARTPLMTIANLDRAIAASVDQHAKTKARKR
jgi:hypothetical protein